MTTANQVPATTIQPAYTIQDVKAAVPSNLRSSITQDLVDKLNTATTDDIARDAIQKNFLSYVNVMKEGKFKLDEYLSAVMFVSFKLMGDTDKDAYAKTFPDRYLALVQKGTPDKTISSYVSMFRKGKLVNLIMEQSLVPTWVLNNHMFQEALNTQFDLMKNAQSEKVRTEAANSLLTHLKKPEPAKGAIKITMGDAEQNTMNALVDAMNGLVDAQRSAIVNGTMKTIDVAGSRLIAEDVEDVI